MDLQVEKIELAKRFVWNDLPDYVKTGITKGQKQAKEGKTIPHQEVMKKYAKYL